MFIKFTFYIVSLLIYIFNSSLNHNYTHYIILKIVNMNAIYKFYYVVIFLFLPLYFVYTYLIFFQRFNTIINK